MADRLHRVRTGGYPGPGPETGGAVSAVSERPRSGPRARNDRHGTRSALAYILAASHSGSTLLAMLLGAHPEVCTVGELKLNPQALGDPERYRCSCGQRIRACAFWRKVAAGMAARGHAFDVADARTDYRTVPSAYARRLLRPMHRGRLLELVRDAGLAFSPTWRAAFPQVQARNAALVAVLRDLTGARVVVDSSKIALRLKYLRRNPELDVRIIRLVRDGRAVALTYTDPARFADARSAALRAGGAGGDRRSERLSMARAALEWRRNNEEAEHLLARCDPTEWVEVRYEDLCRRTDETLDRLFRFLGVDPARHVRDFRSVEHHVIGNGMRFDTTSQVRLDERWKSEMSDEDRRTFDAVAGEMNRRYGYA